MVSEAVPTQSEGEKPVEPEIVATPFPQKRNTTEEQKATPKKLAKTSSSGDSLKKAVADANRLKALYFQVQGQVETFKSTMKTDPSWAWSTGDADSDMHTAKANQERACRGRDLDHPTRRENEESQKIGVSLPSDSKFRNQMTFEHF